MVISPQKNVNFFRQIKSSLWFLILMVVILTQILTLANEPISLLYKEDFREIYPATPVTQEHIENKDLVLMLYGSAQESLKKSHHEHIANDPYYLWSGKCLNTWAVSFKNKKKYLDLTGNSKIKVRTKQSGLRKLHLILKLKDGTWLVSQQGKPASRDWKITEFNLEEMDWYTLNMETITERGKASSIDISQVDEIGFTDLMKGGLTPASSRLDWFEVYGKFRERT